MKNNTIQKTLLRFISNYNDGKFPPYPDIKEMDSEKLANGLGHPKFISSWIETEFIGLYKYSKKEIDENLRLLSEDKEINVIPNENGEFKYLETEKPISLTPKGYRRISLSIFERYPFPFIIGITAGIITIINGIIPWIKILSHYLIFIIIK